MKKIVYICLALVNLLFVNHVYAGTDPVGWSLFPASGFPAQTQVGSSYSVTYTLTNNLPTALPVTISKTYTGNTITVDDSCNRTLASHASCTIYIGIQPARAGAHAAQVTIQYGHNRIPLPTLSTTATSVKTSENIDGYVTEPLPPNSQVGAGYSVIFTFLNDSNSSVTATSVPVTGFTPSSNTCTSAIAAKSSCSVRGTYTPSATGQATIGVTYNYSTNGSGKSVPLTSTTNVSNGGGGGCSQVNGLSTLTLPTSTYIYSDNIVKFTFTNNCPSTAQTLGTVNLTASLDGTSSNNFLTKGAVSGVNDTCSGATLSPGQHCNVFASVIPTNTGSSLSVDASVSYNGGANLSEAISNEQVSTIPSQTTQHNVTFINQCTQPVWFEFLNGNGQPGSSGVLSPDPIAGSAASAYEVQGQAGGVPNTTTLAITQYENGKIYARTGCDPSTMVCATASCQVISGTGTCVVGVGGGQPSTAFESYMTNVAGTDGVYDLSLINGFNVPVEIKGLGPVSTSTTDPNAPYSCTAAGAPIQTATSFSPPLGACPWAFTPPNVSPDATANFVFVSAGADTGCGSGCTSPQVCGESWNTNINTGAGVPINRHCGTFQGYWTVADFIGYNNASDDWGTNDLYTTYQINSPLATAYGNSTVNAGGATNYDLYGCVPTSNDSLDSGYKAGKSRVCGCYNWDQSGSVASTNVTQQCCTSTTCGNTGLGVVDAPNPLWQSTVFGRISWLKQACPTAYSYQFDDKSSSFQCNQAGKFTSYEIVFCPGGKTGSPV